MTISKIRWGIYIGDDTDLDVERLKQHKINTWIDLTKLGIDIEINDVTVKEVEDAVIALNGCVERGLNVLVFCNGGIDRAPFVVALYLHRYHNCTFQEAYGFVKERRPQTFQHLDWYEPFSVI